MSVFYALRDASDTTERPTPLYPFYSSLWTVIFAIPDQIRILISNPDLQTS
jgi:hypothetical protein